VLPSRRVTAHRQGHQNRSAFRAEQSCAPGIA
jgi:hypothetical protein